MGLKAAADPAVGLSQQDTSCAFVSDLGARQVCPDNSWRFWSGYNLHSTYGSPVIALQLNTQRMQYFTG